MAETKIEWADYTFNPWRGCTKVSPGCQHCYAETLSKRNPRVLGEWGPDGTRVIAAESGWRQPLAWDRAAREAGERRLVFCASLADVFEHRPDLLAPRSRLFRLIEQTPHLIWLLLTKRPENVERLTDMASTRERWPNAWLGVSVESAKHPVRLSQAQAVRHRFGGLFISAEPLLGPLDRIWSPSEELGGVVQWVIVGGESGAMARPMHPAWVRAIRDQCLRGGVPFFFKQWGEWRPDVESDRQWAGRPKAHRWPEEGVSYRVGKASAGATLDGREYREFPASFGRMP